MNFEKKKANISVDKLPKRLVSLDILRGVAIFGVILVHVSYKLFDASWLMDSFYSGNLSFSPFTWFLIVLLGYFGTWHGFFLFISAIVNSLTFSKKARMEHDMNKLLKKNVVGGVVIVFIGYLVEGLGYWGYFGTAIRSGDWSNFRPFLSENFWIQTLQIIGFALIINGFILFFLLKNEGYKKIKRNILIYVILIFLVLFSTPFLNDLISNNYILGWPDIYVVSHYFNFKTMLLNIVIGPKFPLLPFLVSSFVGTVIGLFLSKPNPKRKGLLYFVLSGLLMIFLGSILIVIGFRFPSLSQKYHIFTFTTIENTPSIGSYLVRLGGQMILVMILLNQIEFRGRGEKVANKKMVKFFRRWSTLSLTIYSFNILELFPRWILSVIIRKSTGINLMEHYVIPKEYFYLIVFLDFYVLLFYELIIQILLKLKMRGSFEWAFVKLLNAFSSIKSNKLKNDLIQENVYWINYKQETVSYSD